MEQNEPKISLGKAAAIVISSSFLITVLVVGVFVVGDKKKTLNINKRAAENITTPVARVVQKQKPQEVKYSFETVKDIFKGNTKISEVLSSVFSAYSPQYPTSSESNDTDEYDTTDSRYPDNVSQYTEESTPDPYFEPTEVPTEVVEETPTPDIPTNEPTVLETPTPTPTEVVQKLGDANGDDIVNDIDYTNYWLPNYGTNVSCGPSCGDFNDDGVVDSLDYIIWVNNYEG